MGIRDRRDTRGLVARLFSVRQSELTKTTALVDELAGTIRQTNPFGLLCRAKSVSHFEELRDNLICRVDSGIES